MDPKHTGTFIPTQLMGHEILDVEPCYIEDRRVRVPQLLLRDSIVLRYTCGKCHRVYLAILPADDTCYVGATCGQCHQH